MSLLKAYQLNYNIFYKILNPTLIHKGFQYKIGVNIDTNLFNPIGYCQKGGLYFTDIDNIHRHIKSSLDKIAIVTLNPYEPIWIEKNQYKAHKINITQIHDINTYKNSEFLQIIFQKNDSLIQHFKFPSESACIKSVEQNGYNIQFIPNPTFNVCLSAVRQNGNALMFINKYIKHYSIICNEAVKQCGTALQYVKKQTRNICMEAVKKDGNAIIFVNEIVMKNEYNEICKKALESNWSIIKHFNEPTKDLCFKAISVNPMALKYIKNQTKEMCIYAKWINLKIYKNSII
jgi:hypothetical protein